MSLETTRSFLLWCSILNYSMLILWAALATLGRRRFYPLVSRIYPMTLEQFNLMNYAGIALYKMSIILFNIIPCIALYIVK